MKTKKALIAGSSGLTGGYCLNFLLESPAYGVVKSLVRRPSGIKHPKLEEYEIDFDDPGSYSDTLRVDDVYCCLGTTMKKAGSKKAFYKVDYTYPVELAGRASEAGASRFCVISAMGANTRSAIYYSRVKGEMEYAVGGIPFIEVYIFRPSLLLGELGEQRFFENIGQFVSKIISPIMAGSLRKYRPVHAETVAWSMVHAVTGELPAGIYESHEITTLSDRSRPSG